MPADLSGQISLEPPDCVRPADRAPGITPADWREAAARFCGHETIDLLASLRSHCHNRDGYTHVPKSPKQSIFPLAILTAIESVVIKANIIRKTDTFCRLVLAPEI